MQFDHNKRARCTIDHFCDGDTVVVLRRCRCCKAISEVSVRLPGIESFEPIGPDRAKARAIATSCDQLWAGKQAFLTSLTDRSDKYGRLISDLLIGSDLLSELLIKHGHAWLGVGNRNA